MKQTFKTCSCGFTYNSLADFLQKTLFIGIMNTPQFIDVDLELRNCLSCNTTITRKLIKELS